MGKQIKIGVAGLGTVGAHVVQILEQKQPLLTASTPHAELKVVAVSARDAKKDRGISAGSYRWVEDARQLADDAALDVIVELIGGADGVALELCQRALEHGKHVVTANKAMLAKHGAHLASLAEAKGVALLFEASVAGGIPVMRTLRDALTANQISRVSGIMNGTCNYILSTMEKDKRAFADVLQEAQKLGYAETPPDLDVDGWDAAHKLTILTSMVFGTVPALDAIEVHGIRSITPDDMRYAHGFGYTIRLLGSAAKDANGAIRQAVQPYLVAYTSPLAAIHGSTNAIHVQCDELGTLFLSGAGAGAGPTASAVVADLTDIARGVCALPWGRKASTLQPLKTAASDAQQAYYMRVEVADKEGTLAAISSVLGTNGISIEQITQTPHAESNGATLALLTRVCKSSAMKAASDALEKAEYSTTAPQVIAIAS